MKKNRITILVKCFNVLMLIVKAILITTIRIYQLVLSPYMGGHCRFEPSCSNYAISAICNHNLFYAVFLIFKRLLRCHPFGGDGFDPIPAPNHSNKEIR